MTYQILGWFTCGALFIGLFVGLQTGILKERNKWVTEINRVGKMFNKSGTEDPRIRAWHSLTDTAISVAKKGWRKS